MTKTKYYITYSSTAILFTFSYEKCIAWHCLLFPGSSTTTGHQWHHTLSLPLSTLGEVKVLLCCKYMGTWHHSNLLMKEIVSRIKDANSPFSIMAPLSHHKNVLKFMNLFFFSLSLSQILNLFCTSAFSQLGTIKRQCPIYDHSMGTTTRTM
jgi:hypothetical protein